MHFIFWQAIPSPHQSSFLRALAALGHSVTLVADREYIPARQQMGWVAPDLTGVELIFNPTEHQLHRLIKQDADTNIHISSGVRCARCASHVHAHAGQIRLGMLGEPGDPRGAIGVLRKMLYRVEAINAHKSIDFVLAIGQTGVRWYTTAGYPTDRVFPFAYVVETPLTTDWPTTLNRVVRIGYVGSFIQLKAVPLLLRALMGDVSRLNWQLDLVGDGPERKHLEMMVRRSALAPRVKFHGYIPMRQVMAEMARFDVLVLPSQYDGWGAVVNEALMSGVPVICSDECGAADLLAEPLRGTVFRAKSLGELTQALRASILHGPRTMPERMALRQWSICIGGNAVARYFIDIMRHIYEGYAQPTPPWRNMIPLRIT